MTGESDDHRIAVALEKIEKNLALLVALEIRKEFGSVRRTQMCEIGELEDLAEVIECH